MATGLCMDEAVDRVSISGPILAHVLHDFNASRGDCDGVLFGHLQKTISAKFEDDDELSGMREDLTAIITGFFCSGSLLSFYDACGRTVPSKLASLLSGRGSRGGDPLIGWFAGRHSTPMRPSLRETAVTRCLRLSGLQSFENPSQRQGKGAFLRSDPPSESLICSTRDASPVAESPSGAGGFSFQKKESLAIPERQLHASGGTLQNSGDNIGVPPSSPCLFMLITESGAGQAVHAEEYRVYQYHFSSQVLTPRTLRIANIGPAFRVQYDSFSPVTEFPLLFCGTEEESESQSSSTGKNIKRREAQQVSRRTRPSLSKEQMLLDAYSDGYTVERLASLANPDGLRHVPELEDLYSKMLLKLETLARHVSETSSVLIQQEKANKQLRLKAASLE